MTEIRARTRKEQDVYAGRLTRIFRMLAGMRQEDMAKVLDLSISQYKWLEYGKRGLDIPDMAKVCEMFGIDKAEFFKRMTFNMDGSTVQYDAGKSYDDKKQRAQAMAKELAPYGCIPAFQAELKRLGKRYGLIQEFRDRGILKQ